MNQNLYLFPIQLSELQEMLRSIVRDELSQQLHEIAKPEETVDIVTREVLAQRLNVSQKTISHWAVKGRIPYLQVGGRQRYDYRKVVAALAKEKGGHRYV